ncbi:MAG: fatty acid desaturase [Thermoanaerobaculia bacterium]
MSTYYAEHTAELRQALGRELPTAELRRLHRRSPLRHAAVAAALYLVLAAAMSGAVLFDRWFFWLPCSVVAGFAIFDFTVLLHEVVHRTITEYSGRRLYRFLGLLYAIPSGISARQFTRWHLDHHAGLGSDLDDPKRHYLSPKRNARWLKLLYFTPALFFIYFRAAKRETSAYSTELQRKIARERTVTILLHLIVLAAIGFFAGWWIAFRVYLVPYFLVFPVAFALNRLGQHYDIDPADPARWSTLMKASWFWDVVFLCSNYHLEHHYFPSVPLYNLPRLQRLLLPFYAKRGIVPRSYGSLLWNYIVMNRAPHTRWSGEAPASPVAVSR